MAETLSRYSLAAIANLSTRWMELTISPVGVLPGMRRLLFKIGDGRALKTEN